MGADYIEPDLVATKDGILIARHENEISGTTNVSEKTEFAGRKTTKTIDGVAITGWFTEDFTLAEIKTLRAKERIPDLRPQNTAFNGQFEVPTFQEVIDLAQRESRRGREIGIYPETKHPTYFQGIGLALEDRLVRVLHQNGYRDRRSPVFIQSFEVTNLEYLKTKTQVRLVQLVSDVGKPYDFVVSGDPRTYADLTKPAELEKIARYAAGIGPNKNLIIPRDASGRLLAPTTLVRDAHRAGLVVHSWTFRNENNFLPLDFRAGNPSDPAYLRQYGRAIDEDIAFFRAGVDGIFTDNPDTGVDARRRFDR
jgi:glycerophosphoryl diester phosphodiesterase